MSNDWRANAPDGSKYGLDPKNYSNEQAYLCEYNKAINEWRKKYYGQDHCALNLWDYDDEDDFVAALNKNRYKVEHGIELMPLEHATREYFLWLERNDKKKIKGLRSFAFFQIDGKNYPWYVEWDENRPSHLYDLHFSLPGLPTFHADRVSSIHFLIKKENLYASNHNEYTSYYHYREYQSPTIKDTDDFYMIVRYMEFPTMPSFDIYEKFTLLYTIHDIDQLEFNEYCFNPSYFVGHKYRENKTYFFIDGIRHMPHDLDMSFKEWCLYFGEPKLLDVYSPTNATPADKIRWNDDHSVQWKKTAYNDNETYRENLSERTRIYRGKSRVDNDLIRGTNALEPFFDTASEVVKGLLKTNITSKERLCNTIIDQIRIFIASGLSGNSWIGLENCSNGSVEAVAPYPNGMHGDIDHYLAETYGSVSEIDGSHCKITIPYSEYEIIALLAESSNYDKSDISDHSSIVQFMNDHNIFYACMDMLWYCNDHGLLQSSSPLWRAVSDLKREYRGILRKRRREVYSDIIKNGNSHYRWKTESIVYGIVRGAYPDAIFQYHSEWLGSQSLDVFIPSIRVGIEYNGIQHYEPVAFFGGEESLVARQEMDKRKRRLCKENEVALLVIRYDDPLTEIDILNHIKQLAKNSP